MSLKKCALSGCRFSSNLSSSAMKVMNEDGVRKITLCNPKTR